MVLIKLIISTIKASIIDAISLDDGASIGKANNSKKGLATSIYGIMFLAVMLASCSQGEYQRQLVDGHPVYSAELVKFAERGDTAAQ